MAEYTTTEEVRAAFIDSYRWPDGSRLRGRSEKSEAEFDRWIAAHDRTVKAEALREAAEDILYNGDADRPLYGYVAMYRRADQIEGGAE